MKSMHRIIDKCKYLRDFSTSVARNCSKDGGVYRVNILKGVNKQSNEESSEIISLSNDSVSSIGIPRSINREFPRFYYENWTIEASQSERGVIDLSCNTHANLPIPPTESTEETEWRPYDSLVSLGDAHGQQRNEKFVSDEQMGSSSQMNDNIEHSRRLNGNDQRKLALFASNERRFGIGLAMKTSGTGLGIEKDSIIDIDQAFDHQQQVMRAINTDWLETRGLSSTKEYLDLFLPFSPDTESEIGIDKFMELANLLELGESSEIEILSCSDLIDKIDMVVRGIVLDWIKRH